MQVTYPVGKYLDPALYDKKSGKPWEQMVIDLITSTIEPETWETTGGLGKIQYFSVEKTLVISNQNQYLHEEIAELFAALDRLLESGVPEPCTVEQLNEEAQPAPPTEVSAVYYVADLVTPADELTPVVCQWLNKTGTGKT